MPGVSVGISLTDGMTAPLKNIEREIGNLNSAFGRLQNSSLKTGDRFTTVSQRAGAMANGVSKAGSMMANSLNSVTSKVMRLSATIGSFVGIKSLVEASDSFVQMAARVGFVNDGLQTNEELLEKIHQAANRSRSSYRDMANFVTKIGNNAKGAFSTNDELIKFAETVQKQFIIGGATSAEQSAASLQLSQGLAAGALRGDEFRSIAEQAPMILNSVAKYLNITRGEVRALSLEGKLTTDVIKNAILQAADETDAQMQTMRFTFSQMWQIFKNDGMHALEPVYNKINDLGKTKAFDRLFKGAMNGFHHLIDSALPFLENLEKKLNDPKTADNIGKIAEAIASLLPPILALTPALAGFAKLTSIASALGSIGFNPLTMMFGDGDKMGLLFKGFQTFSQKSNKSLSTIGKASFMNAFRLNVSNGLASASGMFSTFADSAKTKLGNAFKNLKPSVSTDFLKQRKSALSDKGLINAGLMSPSKDNKQTTPKTLLGRRLALSKSKIKALKNPVTPLQNMDAPTPFTLPKGNKSPISFSQLTSNVTTGLVGLKGTLASGLGGLTTFISSFGAPIALAIAGLFAVGAAGGGLLMALGTMEGAFKDSILRMIDTAKTDGPNIVKNFANSFIEKAPTAINNGAEIITKGLEALAVNAPGLVTAGGEMLLSLIKGFATNLPQMAVAGTKAVTGFMEGLAQNIGLIIDGALWMLKGLAHAIADSMPVFISSSPNVVSGLIQGIITYLPDIIICAGEIVIALAKGIVISIPHIIVAVFTLVQKIGEIIVTTDWWGIGNQIIQGINNGIISMTESVSQTIANLGQQVYNWFVEQFNHILDYDWAGLGQNIINGIAEGVGNATQGTVGDKILGDMLSFVSRGEKDYKINSPSKVMADRIGKFLPLGIAVGFQKAMPKALAMMDSAASDITGISTPTVTPQVGAVATTDTAMPTGVQANMAQYQATVVGTQEQTHAFTTADSALQAEQMVDAYGQITGGVTAEIGNTFSAVVSGMQNINNYLASLPSLYLRYGIDMMVGLRNGMASQISNVVDTTNNLVAAVKNAFITGLGIHSPSKVTTEYGMYTGEGFINGLSSTQLVAFVKAIVNDMKGAFGKGNIDLDVLVKYLQGDSMSLVDWMNEFDGGSYVKGVPGSGKGDKALKYFLGMINDNTYGYTFGGRGPTEFDCASSISWALRQAGFDMGGGWDTTGVANSLFALGWQKVPNNGNPKRGDIVMNEATHVEWALGNGQLAGFHSNYDGMPGDSSGTEASVGPYYEEPWEYYIRYPAGGFGDDGASMAEAIKEAYERVILGITHHANGGNMQALGDYGSAIGGAARWADVVRQALRLTGQSEQYVGDILWCIENESGGNPYAINNWDSNAAMGDPSRGLMQTIGSTFNAYRLPSLSPDIYDPLSNIVAGIRYMLANYGSIDAVVGPRRQSWYGYASGTTNARKGWAWVGENGPELVNFGGGETVLNNRDSMRAINESANGAVSSSGASQSYGLGNVVINVNMNNVNVASDMDIQDVATKLGQYLKDELAYQPLAYHGG